MLYNILILNKLKLVDTKRNTLTLMDKIWNESIMFI